MRALVAAIVVSMAAPAPAQAQSAGITGIAGYLSEWAFSGKLTATGANEFSGVVTWKHIGVCSHDGPQEKLVEITVQIFRAGPVSQVHATLAPDGARCSYDGPLSANGTGHMDCPDAKGVPATLSFNIE